MARLVKISILVSVGLFFLTIFISMNTALQYESMLLGMGMGMSTYPAMTHFIRKWKTDRKVSKILSEIHESMNVSKEQKRIKKQDDDKINPETLI